MSVRTQHRRAVSPMTVTPARILIGSGNRLIARMLGGILQDAGYQVRRAHSAAALLEQFQAERPDLALLDLGEPDAACYDVCAQLRNLAGNRPLPLIALADTGGSLVIRQVFDAGASDFALKPVDPAVLRGKVRRALQEREDALALCGRQAVLHRDLPPQVLGTWRYDPLTRLLDLSPELGSHLALGDMTAGQQLSALLRCVATDDRREVRAALRRTLHLGREYTLTHRLTDRHGFEQTVSHRLQPVIHEQFGHGCVLGEIAVTEQQPPAGLPLTAPAAHGLNQESSLLLR